MRKHPGLIVRGGLSDYTVTAIAKDLGMARPSVSNTLNGRVRVTPKFALKLEEVYGFSAKKLVIQQAVYDLEREKTQCVEP